MSGFYAWCSIVRQVAVEDSPSLQVLRTDAGFIYIRDPEDELRNLLPADHLIGIAVSDEGVFITPGDESRRTEAIAKVVDPESAGPAVRDVIRQLDLVRNQKPHFAPGGVRA